jgi:hypothetical protein
MVFLSLVFAATMAADQLDHNPRQKKTPAGAGAR